MNVPVPNRPASAAASTTRSPGLCAQADAHDRRLRATILRLQYYGTVGSNRDRSTVIRRRCRKSTGSILRPQINPARPAARPQMKSALKSQWVLDLDKCIRVSHLQRHLQERMDQPRGHGICVVQQRRNQARHRLSEGLGRPGALEGRLETQAQRLDRAAHQQWRVLANIFANPDLPQIDDYYEPFTFDYQHLQQAPEMSAMPTARPFADFRRADGKNRMGAELGGNHWA